MSPDNLSRLFSRPPLSVEGGKFYFIPARSGAAQASAGSVRAALKRWPRLYRAVTFLMNDLFEEGMSARDAIATACGPDAGASGCVVLNVGSGVQDMDGGVINIDAAAFGPVSVVADAADLPFRDACADTVIAVSLLEHCPDPDVVIREMIRVLKPGGYVYCSLPFLYPVHGSPSDYVRFTLPGLVARFPGFDVIAAGTQSGPATAWAIQCAYMAAALTSFGSRRLYALALEFWIAVTAPLRACDFLFRLFPQRLDAAAAIYFFARKPA